MDKEVMVNLLNTVYFIGTVHGSKKIMLPKDDRIKYFETLIKLLGEDSNA